MGDALARKQARTPSLDRPLGRSAANEHSFLRPSVPPPPLSRLYSPQGKEGDATDGRTLASGGADGEEEEAAAMINLSFLLKGKWSWLD